MSEPGPQQPPSPYGGPPGSPYGPGGSPYGPAGSPYGAPYPVVDHPQGTTVLVLGILSLVVCGVLGPFAWWMGTKALREVDARPGYYRNRSNISVGRILGMVSTGLIAVSVVAFVVFFAAIAASSA